MSQVIDKIIRKHISIDEFEKYKCSYVLSGDTKFNAIAYNCSTCDPKRISPFCSKCLTCHSYCEKKGAILTPLNNNMKMDFICSCGKDWLHTIKSQEENTCNLNSLFNNTDIYRTCSSCNANLCPICKSICHLNCRKPVQTKEVNGCGCSDANHNINEIIFTEVSKNVRKYGYTDIYQLLYKAFDIKAMGNFIYFIKNLFEKINSDDITEGERTKLDFIFKGLYDIFTKHKNSNHFHNELKLLFTEDLIIKTLSVEDFKIYSFDLLFLFYRIHIRNDFFTIKLFSVYDYLNTSTIERLQNRELMIQTIPEEIKIKYGIFGKKSTTVSLSKLTYEMIELLDDERITNTCLRIILKYLYFLIRLHIFNLDELIHIIRMLYKNYDIGMNCKIIWEKMYHDKCVVQLFSKLLYVIGVNYNDLVVLNSINQGKAKYKFIHSQSEYGEMLLKLALKNNMCYTSNLKYEKRMLESKLYIVNMELLKLFIISNNNYYNNFISHSNAKTSQIYLYRNILDLLNSSNEYKNIYSYFSSFKYNLEKEIKNYFFNKSDNRLFERLNGHIGVFINSLNEFFIDKESNKPISPSFGVVKYHNKLESVIFDQIKNLNPCVLNNTDFIIDCFRMFNLNEILLTLIHLLRNISKEESTKILQNNLGLFTLLLFNESGVNYLLRGSCVKKFFEYINITNKKLLDFIQLIFEGINTYHIHIVIYKKISKILGILFDSIITSKRKNKKTEIIQSIKLLSEVSKFYDKEELKKILSSLVLILNDQQMLDYKKLRDSLSMMNVDKYSLVSIKNSLKDFYANNLNYFTIFKCDRDSPRDSQIFNPQTNQVVELVKLYTNKKNNDTAMSYKSSASNKVIEEYKIYFSLFKIFTESIHYVSYYDEFKKTINMMEKVNDIDNFKVILGNTFLKLNQRKVILKYLLSYYFIDYIKEYDISKYISTTEYMNFRETQDNEVNDRDDIVDQVIDENGLNLVIDDIVIEQEDVEGGVNSEINEKIRYIENIYWIIDIFIQEYDNVIYFLFASEDNDYGKIHNYLRLLITCFKFISDFFFEKKKLYKDNLSNHITIQFYKVVRSFLKNSHIIRKALDLLHNNTISKFKVNLIEYYYQTLSYESKNYRTLIEMKNFFDVSKIYECAFQEIFPIIKLIDKEKNLSLSKNLHNHDKNHLKNFFTIGLIFDGPFHVIYQNEENSLNHTINKSDTRLKSISDEYISQFYDIKRTNFLSILGFVSTEDSIDYRILLSNYFINHITNYSHIGEKFDIDMLNIYTKLLYFDGVNTQKSLYTIVKNDDNHFFISFFCQFQMNIVLSLTTARNVFISQEFYNHISLKTELMVQFLQLLGEGFCRDFKENIFRSINIYVKKDKIYSGTKLYDETTILNTDHTKLIKNKDILLVLLKYINEKDKIVPNNKITVKKTILREKESFAENDEELSEDYISVNNEEEKLNEVKKFYLIKNEKPEYGLDTQHEVIINLDMEENEVNFFSLIFKKLFTLHKYLSLNSKLENELPNDNLIVLQTYMIDFLIEFNGVSDEFSIDIINLFEKDETTLRRIRSVLFNRGEGLSKYRNKILLFCKLNYLKLLISIVQNESISKYLIKLHKKIGLITLFEEIIFILHELITQYQILNKISNDINLSNTGIVKILRNLYIGNPEFEKSLELEFCITAFKYIRIIGEVHKINGIETYFNENRENIINSEAGHNKFVNSFNTIFGLNVYDFLNELVSVVEIRYKGQDIEKIYPIFIVKPPITFLLSEQTKIDFIQNVDRTNSSTKLNELLERTDYFLFEMFFNYNLAVQNKFNSLYRYIRMDYLEMLNYLIILGQQIQLLSYFFASDYPNAESREDLMIFIPKLKFNVRPGNFILSLCHIVFCGSILLIWSIYYLQLNYQKLMMRNYNVNFLIGNTESNRTNNLIKFTNNFSKENRELLKNINNDVPILSKLYTCVFDMFLFNRQVSTIIYTFGLSLIYLITEHPIFLVIPVLFITNFMPLLSSIIYAVRLKWRQLALVLFFTYMVVYLFGWLAFFYLYSIYNTETTNSKGDTIKESLCSSSIECWMNMINYGVRAGGGIGDVIPKISYYDSPDLFVKVFFYNMTFQIIIVLILGNIFLGIIVDAFTDLRDEKNIFDNDSQNICFVCQISRDKATAKAIDFENHTEIKHNLWKYVDFMIYLFINNPNEFNQYELDAYSKLIIRDMSWVPIVQEN